MFFLTRLYCSRIAPLILLLCLEAICILKLYLQNANWKFPLSNRSLAPILNIQNPVEFSNESEFKCINVNLNQTQFPMCLYAAEEDIWVSKVIRDDKYFEGNQVLNFVDMLRDHADFTIVDLGTYSLPLAHLGRHVIVIEPNWNTLRRLSKSVFLGDVVSNTDILHHAIGKERSTTTLKVHQVSGVFSVLMNNVTCTENCFNLDIPVSVITLNDLIPIMRNKKAVIKVDTEGTEINIFTPSSASEFFHRIDVVLVQMEWNLPLLYPQRQFVDNFLQFFYDRNYAVFDINSGQKLGLDWAIWPNDVIFKKASCTGSLFSVESC